MLTDEQIESMVKQKYPKTEKEGRCAQERERLKQLRDFYRERLKEKHVDMPTLN